MKPNIVYHYCNLETFMTIIKNSSIRLSNISKSNDSDEIRYCFDAFEKVLRETCKEFCDKYVKNKTVKIFFNDIRYSNLVSKAVLNDSLIYYVACFSSEADLLSQWRGYANDGKGVAIGFYTKSFSIANHLENIRFNKITYAISELESNLHDETMEKLIKTYNSAKRKTDCSIYTNALNMIISKMVYDAVFHKHPAFKEEKEWRLVYYPFGNIRNLSIAHKYNDMASNHLFYDRMLEPIEYDRECDGLLRGKLNFRCTDDKISSYIDINFEKIKLTTLAEIIIGPKSNIDDKDLRLFLMSNGYDLQKINIKKSIATYR